MSTIIGVGLPILVMLAMTIVGLELTVEDLGRVLHYPVEVAAGVIGQVLTLPLIAAGLILLLHPEPAVAGGLILAAAAPQAMTSNYYCLLGRGNVALSVTLTAASSVLALASTPLVSDLAFGILLARDASFALPPGKVMQQILTGLLLPVSVGMLVRHRAPGFVERNRARFQRLTAITIAAMLSSFSRTRPIPCGAISPRSCPLASSSPRGRLRWAWASPARSPCQEPTCLLYSRGSHPAA
ncbi:MAG TPA: bile acid:sodium symporter [Burkholderiales bacterium]|nr:bile acid:sodium symporter [Burkholderiales bacterium]